MIRNGEAKPSTIENAEGRQCLNTYHGKATRSVTTRGTPLRQQEENPAERPSQNQSEHRQEFHGSYT